MHAVPRTIRRKKTKVAGIYVTKKGHDHTEEYVVVARWTDRRTGRRKKREGTAATLALAIALKESLQREDVAATTATRQRLADYVQHFLATNADRLAPSTRERFTCELAHWVVQLGDIFVDALVPTDVRASVAEMRRGARPATVNSRLRTLRRVLEDAVTDGHLPSNPASAVRGLKEGRTQGPRGTALDAEQFHRFVGAVAELIVEEEVSPDIGRLILLLAWTGMRKGEALALRWEDYDTEARDLHVDRAVWRSLEKATKTDDPRRVHVVDPLAAVLEAQRRWLLETQHAGLQSTLMFPASAHQKRGAATRYPDREESWYRAASCLVEPIRAVVKRAKVPAVSPHSFRRTQENLARKAGVDQLVRRAQAGWRSEKAQAIYALVDNGERVAAGCAVVKLVEAAGVVRPSGTPSME